MARQSRIHFNGAVYHVLLDGQQGQCVFESTSDKRVWEGLLSDGSKRFDYRVLAYHWATGRIQMAIQVADSPLSKIMQNLSFRYTRHFNKAHVHAGPVFQGRYKAIVIDPEQYLAPLIRHIHCGPLKRGRARPANPGKWTSHQAYLGDQSPSWLDCEPLLLQFGKSPRLARTAYASFVSRLDEHAAIDFDRGELGGRLLGDASFRRRVLKPRKVPAPIMRLPRLVKLVCQHEKVREAELNGASRARDISEIRQIVGYFAIELHIDTLTAVADRFNRDLTTMSRNQRHFRDRLAIDKALASRLRVLRRHVVGSTR